MFDRNTLLIAYDPAAASPGSRRGPASVSNARLPLAVAEDYAVRAAFNPTAADTRTGAYGTITFDRNANHEPLPKFSPTSSATASTAPSACRSPDRHRHPQRPQYELHRLVPASMPATR